MGMVSANAGVITELNILSPRFLPFHNGGALLIDIININFVRDLDAGNDVGA